jgi:cyanate permease
MTFQRPALVGLNPPARVWPAVWLLYGAGLMAAAQLGKLSALAPVITPALGLSLAGAAWTVSLIEVGGATLGAVAGVLAQRCGLWRTLKWGLAALALAGLGSASAASAGGLMGWRVLEAAGYLGITVSAPVLIARLTAAAGPRTQALAMSLWSTFVPAGLAFGASAAAAAAVPLGWRGALLAGGLLATALALAVAWRGTRDDEHKPTAASPPLRAPARVGAAAWCLALSFGLFALFAVGVIGLLPTLLVQGAGLTPAAAGQWTGLASLSAVLGSALGAVLLRRHWPARWPGLLALALPAVLAWGVFAARPDATWAVVLAVAINVLGGVVASLAFAALPRVVGDAGQLVRANGLLTQFGASGSLLGPPVMAAGVGAWGWPGAAAVGVVVSVLALPLAWRALRGV